jgi:hypothetical protein
VTISSGTICNCSKFFDQMPMMKPNRLNEMQVSARNASIAHPVQDLEIDEELRRCQDHHVR